MIITDFGGKLNRENQKLERRKAEIDYYKDLFGKLFTVFVLIAGGTIANLHNEGFNLWGIVGGIASFYLFVILAIVGYIYKRKINEVEEL